MLDGASAVDVDVNLVKADSSRRFNDDPTANCQLPTNLMILEWRGAIDACLLACSRNRPKKYSSLSTATPFPQNLLPNGAQEKKYLTASCSL